MALIHIINYISIFFIVCSLELSSTLPIPALKNQHNLQVSTIVNDFLGKSYIGDYHSKQYTSLFDYLDVSEGNLELDFLNDPSFKSQQKVNTIAVQLYNPIYHDKKAVVLVLRLPNFDEDKSLWKGQSTQILIYKLNKQESKSQTKCNCSFEVILEPFEGSYVPKNTLVSISLAGDSLNNDTCNFKFDAVLHYYDYKITAILYCGFVSLIVFIQILSAYKLITRFSNNQIEASKLSLSTVAFCNIQDFFLTMMHLYFLMAQDQYYVYFILPIFMLVLLSVVFDMKLLFIVWREKYKNQIVTPVELRKKLTMFYIKFYLGLFSYLTIMYFFPYQLWSVLLQAFFILPQIIHNVVKGNNPKFYPFYVFGVLGMRMMLPLYYRGCPDNIYVIQPSKVFCILWVLFFAIQITILLLQAKIGPRFFIPKCLIPGYYNYEFKYKIKQNEDVQECPICLTYLTHHPQIVQPINQMSNSLIKEQAIVMKAPCNHMFHPQCLKIWIDVKLQCPTCRAVLPPLNL